MNGKKTDEIELIYDINQSERYDKIISIELLSELEKWKKKNKTFYNRLVKESWDTQVRLNGIYFDHRTYKFHINLSKMKYLYYVAIQNQLGNLQNTTIRQSFFDNAIRGLLKNQELKLPTPFAIHMSIISSDGKSLLRKRTNYTELYPSAWEAGIGEFMHGPSTTKFPHFDENNKPSLYLYLKNAVAEELNYYKAQEEDFKIYGFAIESQTLSPKMIVVYNANIKMESLIKLAENAEDRSPSLHAVNLNSNEIKSLFTNPKFESWGPTSKLALTLALIQHQKKNYSRSEILNELGDF